MVPLWAFVGCVIAPPAHARPMINRLTSVQNGTHHWYANLFFKRIHRPLQVIWWPSLRARALRHHGHGDGAAGKREEAVEEAPEDAFEAAEEALLSLLSSQNPTTASPDSSSDSHMPSSEISV